MLINLVISLVNSLKVKALECVSAVNQKCMARPKIAVINYTDSSIIYSKIVHFTKLFGLTNIFCLK